jgi:hypothetical protein
MACSFVVGLLGRSPCRSAAIPRAEGSEAGAGKPNAALARSEAGDLHTRVTNGIAARVRAGEGREG